MSTRAEDSNSRPSELVAPFLAVLSIVGSALSLAYEPVKVLPFAFVLALVSAGMAPRNSRLPLIAVLVGAIAFVVAMTIAVVAKNPLY